MTILKVGDFIYSSWGYDQTNINFYKVIKTTNKMLHLIAVEAEKVASSYEYEDKIIPTDKIESHWLDPKTSGLSTNPFVRRELKYSDGGIYVRISDCQTAWPWDGKPKAKTASGWGR